MAPTAIPGYATRFALTPTCVARRTSYSSRQTATATARSSPCDTPHPRPNPVPGRRPKRGGPLVDHPPLLYTLPSLSQRSLPPGSVPNPNPILVLGIRSGFPRSLPKSRSEYHHHIMSTIPLRRSTTNESSDQGGTTPTNIDSSDSNNGTDTRPGYERGSSSAFVGGSLHRPKLTKARSRSVWGVDHLI